ncbi:MAG: hypothetical protein ACRELY_00060 [Polyangiaceae bacterium]
MTARSLISPRFFTVSWPRVSFTSPRALYNFAQLMMVMGYVVVILNPLDGDAMLLGLMCQAVALGLYGVSRSASKTPPTA